MSLEAMVRQLGRHAELGDDDRQALAEMPFVTRTVKMGQYRAKVT